MIDVHSHLLPFVDDGSQDEELSYKNLKKAEEYGVTDMILTPHFRYGLFEVNGVEVEDRFFKFKQGAKERGIGVNLYLAQEVHYSRYMKEDLKNDFYFLMKDNYVLTEFRFVTETDIPEAVYSLRYSGYNPIVAHFERYSYATIEMAKQIKRFGGEIQINATSIVGGYGSKIKKMAIKLLKEGLVDYVASDVHNDRPNDLKNAYPIVVKLIGQEETDNIFTFNAKKLLKEE